MGLGDRLLDPAYKPETVVKSESKIEMPFYAGKIITCPVKFTNDPLEFLEGSEFMAVKLRPIQRQIIVDLFLTPDDKGKNKYTEATVICGMRCHGLGTEILMSDRTVKKVEDIIVGDLLMGIDGLSRTVLELHSGESELFRVEQSHGMDYTVNANHTLSLKAFYGFKKHCTVVDSPVKQFIGKSSFKGYKADFIKDLELSNIGIFPIGVGKFIGFTVDKDHKYCLADGTVTCNSGKSVISSLAATYLTQFLLAKDNPASELRQLAGQQISLEFIANSEEQSKKTAYASYVGTIKNNIWWKRYINYLMEREKNGEGVKKLFNDRASSIIFPEKNVAAWSLHSNSNSLAGMTSIMVIFDELSRFNVSENEIQEESEARSANAVYYTAARSVTSLKPYSRIMTVTSPMYETDFGMQLLYMAGNVRTGENAREIDILRKKYKPKIAYNPKMIGYHYTTFEMAPKVLIEGTDEEYEGFSEADEEFIAIKNQNPTAFRRDYKAIPPGAMNPFIEFPERIDLCVSPRGTDFRFLDHVVDESIMSDGKMEIRSYMTKELLLSSTDKLKRYFICSDAASKKDSFVVAMGHVEEYIVNVTNKVPYRIFIDFIEAWIPDKLNQVTVSFSNVEEIIKQLADKFNVITVTYDQWNSVSSIENLFKAGINTQQLEISTRIYEEFKQLIYSGYVDLPPHEMLLNELRQLNLIRGTKIDHLPGNAKDCADACARVIWCAINDYIERAATGEGMLPKSVYMPTVRSLSEDYRTEMSRMVYGGNPAMMGGNGIFGSKETYIVPNVNSNGFFGKKNR